MTVTWYMGGSYILIPGDKLANCEDPARLGAEVGAEDHACFDPQIASRLKFELECES